MITDQEMILLVGQALRRPARALSRQTLAHSGNVVARVELSDGTLVALRVSAKRRVFDYTRPNLDALRRAGLPVPKVLARGLTHFGGAYVILEWMRGHDLLFALPTMSPSQMVQTAQRVFDAQQRVGQMPRGSAFGWAPLGQPGSLTRWSDVFGPAGGDEGSDPANDDGSAGPPDTVTRLRRLRLSLEPYFEAVQPICFLDDLTVKNVLIDEGEVSAFIDIDEVCYGDPLLAVGQTLACLSCDVGDAGKPYGEALRTCWNPQGEAARALRFYVALWTAGFLNQARAKDDQARVERLAPLAEAALARAES